MRGKQIVSVTSTGRRNERILRPLSTDGRPAHRHSSFAADRRPCECLHCAQLCERAESLQPSTWCTFMRAEVKQEHWQSDAMPHRDAGHCSCVCPRESLKWNSRTQHQQHMYYA